MRTALLVALTLALPAALPAQRGFATPDSVGKSALGGIRLGLFGFSAKGGPDFSAKGGADFSVGGRAVAAVGLDLGDLFTERVRMRPSFEIGLAGDTVNYVGSAELMYRFTPDSVIAVPYVLFGLGLYGQQKCNDPLLPVTCPKLWAEFGLGFELRIDEHVSWLLEYHGEDALRRHRIFFGLTTRRTR